MRIHYINGTVKVYSREEFVEEFRGNEQKFSEPMAEEPMTGDDWRILFDTREAETIFDDTDLYEVGMRKFIVQFQKIDYCSIVVEAEDEFDAWDMVQDSLYEDKLEGYVEDSYETKVTDVEELKDEDVQDLVH